MRPLSLAAWSLTGLLACSAVSFSAVSIAEQAPTPIDQIPVPPARADDAPLAPGAATQPAVLNAGPIAIPAGARVVLLPFDALGDAAGRQWVGKALQDSLTTEVARLKQFTAVSQAADASDTAAALAAAKANAGDVVVFGAYQFNDPEIRMTAQVVDVASGRSIAGLKVSGEFRDLFELEDQLGSQLRTALAPPAPLTPRDKLADDQVVFGQSTPPLTEDDLYSVPGANPQFLDAYNRYYYDWSNFPAYGYGGFSGFSYGGFIYGGFRGGLHRFGYHGRHQNHQVGMAPPPTATPAPVSTVTIGSTPIDQGPGAPPPRYINTPLVPRMPTAPAAPPPAPLQTPAPPSSVSAPRPLAPPPPAAPPMAHSL